MAEKTYEAAGLVSRRWPVVSLRTTRRVTARKGTRREVTKRGMAWGGQYETMRGRGESYLACP
jgi:hypothetical protein